MRVLCNNKVIKWYIESYTESKCLFTDKPSEMVDQLSKADVFIFGDYHNNRFSQNPKNLSDIVDLIKKGKPLIYFGGWNSYSSGGYFDSPLSEILPMKLIPRIGEDDDIFYFPHNTKGIDFIDNQTFRGIDKKKFPISTSYHKFKDTGKSCSLIGYRFSNYPDQNGEKIPIIIKSTKKGQNVLCLSICLTGGGAKDIYIWEQYPYFLKLCLEMVTKSKINFKNIGDKNDKFREFIDNFHNIDENEKISLIRHNLEIPWRESDFVEQLVYLGDIAGYLRSKYAAISRQLILPKLYFNNWSEYKYREIEFYKYYARYVCDIFQFDFGEILYKMAYFTQKEYEEKYRDRDLKKWSDYYIAMGHICMAIQNFGEEFYDSSFIFNNLEMGIKLINSYYENSSSRSVIHDDKLRIRALAICLIIIIQFDMYYRRIGFVLFVPLLNNLAIANFKRKNKYYASCYHLLEEFVKLYTEIPAFKSNEFTNLLFSTLKLISKYSKKTKKEFLDNKRFFSRGVANLKGPGGYWGINFGINLEDILITKVDNNLLAKIYKYVDLFSHIFSPVKLLLKWAGFAYWIIVVTKIFNFFEIPISNIENPLFWLLFIQMFFWS